MAIGSGIRTLVAAGVAIGGAAAGFLLGADINAVVVAAVAGLAAVLIAASGEAQESLPRPPARLRPEQPSVQALIDALAGPVLVTAGTRVACANEAARTLLGAHIVGQDVRIAIRHPAAAERLIADPAEEAGSTTHLVGIGTREQRWEMRVRPVGDERRLVQLVDETQLYAAERMRVDFVANASHELRTPLASLRGFAETLREEAGEDPQLRDRFLGIMLDETRRMQRLIDELISLSRIEAGKFRAPETTVALDALVREVRGALVDLHGGRGADLVLEVAEVPAVKGDRAQLSQLIHNLVGNAMAYGRPGTPVRVELEPVGDMVRLRVADQGEGIPPEHLPRLTERFYRVDAGRSRAVGGTGLGLSIVRHIVERHRGRLDIASTLGIGTTVTVLLPRVEDGALS
ncbi:ATP-binding protein [Sphingomonas desiccabilis]|uniref:histidine kinase n=1 Tax=Sphingomonas desiccabilis TaxID=429134 RepID=A0A4Q2IUK2_9SPHN|nr:ATP-binding protein [Sphingomonas desiccabilis]MBB3911098.1 two-component system phosphate regulon sensor histidine kinase PhoR [Sphingomonas desiccabilis]RXZ32091.1 ATPase [Sphingomonas desiccabilis]